MLEWIAGRCYISHQMTKEVTLDELEFALTMSYDSEILANPDGWTPENPAYGHCSAAAQIIQDLFGGEIYGFRFSVKRWGGRVLGGHFLNVLSDGRRVDFTKSQFPADFPYEEIMDPKNGRLVEREEQFGNAGSAGNYARLKKAVAYNLWFYIGKTIDCDFVSPPWKRSY